MTSFYLKEYNSNSVYVILTCGKVPCYYDNYVWKVMADI